MGSTQRFGLTKNLWIAAADRIIVLINRVACILGSFIVIIVIGVRNSRGRGFLYNLRLAFRLCREELSRLHYNSRRSHRRGGQENLRQVVSSRRRHMSGKAFFVGFGGFCLNWSFGFLLGGLAARAGRYMKVVSSFPYSFFPSAIASLAGEEV